jgi:hypothetical protein
MAAVSLIAGAHRAGEGFRHLIHNRAVAHRYGRRRPVSAEKVNDLALRGSSRMLDAIAVLERKVIAARVLL